MCYRRFTRLWIDYLVENTRTAILRVVVHLVRPHSVSNQYTLRPCALSASVIRRCDIDAGDLCDYGLRHNALNTHLFSDGIGPLIGFGDFDTCLAAIAAVRCFVRGAASREQPDEKQ